MGRIGVAVASAVGAAGFSVVGAAGLVGCVTNVQPQAPPAFVWPSEQELCAVSAAKGGSLAAPGADTLRRLAPRPGRVALSYSVEPGTPGCDTEAELRRYTANMMGVDPFVPEGAPLHTLRIHVDRDGSPFRAVFELRDMAGQVLLQDEVLERTCARVSDRLAVVIADVVFAPEPPPPSCENACTKKLEERIAELERRLRGLERGQIALQEEIKKRKVPPMDLTYALSTGVLITANLTPNVGPGVWLGGELRSGPLSIGLELRAVLPTRVPVGPYDADDSQYIALLLPCGRYSYFFGCAVAGAGGDLAYDSNGPSGARGKMVPALQLGGRLGAEVPFAENRFAVRAWGEVLWTTPNTDIGYGKPGTANYIAWNRPDVSAFFGLGFVVKFGDEKKR